MHHGLLMQLLLLLSNCLLSVYWVAVTLLFYLANMAKKTKSIMI